MRRAISLAALFACTVGLVLLWRPTDFAPESGIGNPGTSRDRREDHLPDAPGDLTHERASRFDAGRAWREARLPPEAVDVEVQDDGASVLRMRPGAPFSPQANAVVAVLPSGVAASDVRIATRDGLATIAADWGQAVPEPYRIVSLPPGIREQDVVVREDEGVVEAAPVDGPGLAEHDPVPFALPPDLHGQPEFIEESATLQAVGSVEYGVSEVPAPAYRLPGGGGVEYQTGPDGPVAVRVAE